MTRRILIVDDESHICDVLRQTFVQEQYEADTAGSALEALEKLEAAPCDLAVVDLLLPGIDGLQLAEAIRLLDPGTPLILMTAYGTPTFEDIASHPAITRYIHKPFELDHLLDLVGQILPQRS